MGKQGQTQLALLDSGRRTRTAMLDGRLMLEVPTAEDGRRVAPAEFRLFGAGVNKSEKGDFLFDDEAARTVLEAFRAKGLSELPLDYEHQSLVTPPIKAPAAGWFVPEVRNGELWATQIKWTDIARAHLEAGEYRYFSPAFKFDKETGRVLRLLNSALTNMPALDAIDALVAASANGGSPMDYEKLYLELKAKNDAMEEECKALRAKLTALTGAGDDAEKMSAAVGLRIDAPAADKVAAVSGLAKLRTDIRTLTGQTTDEGSLGVVTAWKRNADEHASAIAKLAALEGEKLEGEAKDALDAAAKDGKIAPAERPFWEAQIKRDGRVTTEGVALLKAYVAAAIPKVTPGGGSGGGGGTQPPAGAMQLTAKELEICKATGSDPEALRKYKIAKLGIQV